MYEREKAGALEYVRSHLGWPNAEILDAKHDAVVPDGVLVLVDPEPGGYQVERFAVLVLEGTGNVAEDSVDEDDYRRGTAA